MAEQTISVTIELKLGEQFLSDVLVTAFDGQYGGCWYWAEAYSDKAFAFTGDRWDYVTIREKVDGEPTQPLKHWKVDHALLAKGIETLFDTGSKVSPVMRHSLREAVLAQDAGNIDASDADVLVQLAVFGEMVYG